MENTADSNSRRYRRNSRGRLDASFIKHFRGCSSGAKVLGKLPVPGRPTNMDYSRAGPTAPAVGVGGGYLDICTLVYHFSFLSRSL